MRTTAIFGPPGTGKTTELVRRLAERVDARRDDRIAVVSFSKAAARKLTASIPPNPTIKIGTLHSLCFHSLDLTKKDVITPEDFADDTGVDIEIIRPAINLLSFMNNTFKSFDEVYEIFIARDVMTPPADTILNIIEAYNAYKKDQILMDFDDMLIQNEMEPYDLMVVDEAQDMSDLQWKVVTDLNPKELWVAGDDDQSIYTFIGANPHGMVEIGGDHVVLDKSYRLPYEVYNLAGRVICQIKRRKDKCYAPATGNPVGNVDAVGEWDALLPMAELPDVMLFRDKYRMEPVLETIRSLALPYIAHGHPSPLLSKKASLFFNFRKVGYEAFDGYEHMLSDWALNPDISGDATPYDIFRYMDMETSSYLDAVDPDGEPIIISTIHGFKGEEADHVLVDLGCTDRVAEQEYDEIERENEIRVWYTAVTRAKKKLTLIGSNTFVPGV